MEKYFALFFDCLSSCSNGNQLVELTQNCRQGTVAIKFDSKMVEQNLIQAGLAIQLHTFDQIDSTNAEAKRVGQQTGRITQPQVFIANHQTGGYGRLNRDFYSPKDSGLYVSFLIPIAAENFNPGLLTTMTAVASVEAIEKHFPVRLQIKWVNDLILANRKVGGILAEAFTNPVTNQIIGVVIGIGVNLSTTNFPDELQKVAISLSNRPDAKDQTAFVNDFITNFFNHLETYQTGDFMTQYRKKSSVIGHHVRVQFQNNTVTGVVSDIDDDGALLLQTDNQKLKITSGEIIHVRPINE